MKIHHLKPEILVLWHIKVNLIDKEIGTQLTKQYLHQAFNVKFIKIFVILQHPVILILVYHYSFDGYPQPIRSVEI